MTTNSPVTTITSLLAVYTARSPMIVVSRAIISRLVSAMIVSIRALTLVMPAISTRACVFVWKDTVRSSHSMYICGSATCTAPRKTAEEAEKSPPLVQTINRLLLVEELDDGVFGVAPNDKAARRSPINIATEPMAIPPTPPASWCGYEQTSVACRFESIDEPTRGER